VRAMTHGGAPRGAGHKAPSPYGNKAAKQPGERGSKRTPGDSIATQRSFVPQLASDYLAVASLPGRLPCVPSCAEVRPPP